MQVVLSKTASDTPSVVENGEPLVNFDFFLTFQVLVRKADEYNSDKENDDDDIGVGDASPERGDNKIPAKIMEKVTNNHHV